MIPLQSIGKAVTLDALVAQFGGECTREKIELSAAARPCEANEGHLAPLLARRYVKDAKEALDRGAIVLVDPDLARLPAFTGKSRLWIHPHPSWALCQLLRQIRLENTAAKWGDGCEFGANVVFGPRVKIGRRVRIGANCVIGRGGFGWVRSPSGELYRMPQLGGVVIEDDVEIGPLSSIDAGTLGPTILRKGAKLDAQIHVAHNCDVGEGTIVAAQSGFAGSVVIGKGVRIGGQVGVADHLSIGDFAQIAAKSGVIGDVAANAIVAGYPAVPRLRWLRGLASLYRRAER